MKVAYTDSMMTLNALTPAELRALEALARYEDAHEASVAIGLSVQTLRNETQSAYRKLKVRNKTSAFRTLGWLRPPQRFLAN